MQRENAHLCPIPLPNGRDTIHGESIGLTQLSMQKNVSGTVGVCTPVGVLNVVALTTIGRSYPRDRPIRVLEVLSARYRLPSSTNFPRFTVIRLLYSWCL